MSLWWEQNCGKSINSINDQLHTPPLNNCYCTNLMVIPYSHIRQYTRAFIQLLYVYILGDTPKPGASFSHTWKIALYRWTTPNNGLGKLNDHHAIKINHQGTIRSLYVQQRLDFTNYLNVGFMSNNIHLWKDSLRKVMGTLLHFTDLDSPIFQQFFVASFEFAVCVDCILY